MDLGYLAGLLAVLAAGGGGWWAAGRRNGVQKAPTAQEIAAAVKALTGSGPVQDVEPTQKPSADLLARVESIERRLEGIQDDVLKHLNKASARLRRAEQKEAVDLDDDDDDDGPPPTVPLDIPPKPAERTPEDEFADLREWQETGRRGGMI